MDNSDGQFKELLSHLVARLNSAFKSGEYISSMGIYLYISGRVGILLPVDVVFNSSDDAFGFLRSELGWVAVDEEVVAVCTAYVDYRIKIINVFLENRDSYCLKVDFPIQNGAVCVDGARVTDGGVYIFSASG